MYKIISLFCLFLTSSTLADNIDQKKSNSAPQYFLINGVESTVEKRMKHYGVPGVSIAVIKNRKILWSQNYGVKKAGGKNKIDDDTLFQAASISKTLTAAVTLHLSQDGIIKLNEHANKYLTSWKIPDHKYKENNPVLVKQLINHTSGLTVHGFAGYNTKDPIPSLIEVLDGASWSEQIFGSKKVNSYPVKVDSTPGSKYSYSGGGYSVLQQVLVDHTQLDFATLMDKQILAPLKMTHSTYKQPLESNQRMLAATGHIKNKSPVEGNYHIYPEQAAAGLWTTSQDLAKFVIDIQSSLRNGSGTLLSKSTAKRMISPSISDEIGLGFFLRGYSASGLGLFTHDGWNEGFSSTLMGHRRLGYGIIILTNANKPDFNNEIVSAISDAYQWQKF